MLQFCVSIHQPGPDSLSPLGVAFDATFDALGSLGRLFIEPDGSFVWRGTTEGGQAWQLDGNLIDRGEVLDYVQLMGQCPPERLDDVLRTLGWPTARLTFELPRLGIVLEEAEFRRLAATDTGAG